jgi:hypothetical protein
MPPIQSVSSKYLHVVNEKTLDYMTTQLSVALILIQNDSSKEKRKWGPFVYLVYLKTKIERDLKFEDYCVDTSKIFDDNLKNYHSLLRFQRGSFKYYFKISEYMDYFVEQFLFVNNIGENEITHEKFDLWGGPKGIYSYNQVKIIRRFGKLKIFMRMHNVFDDYDIAGRKSELMIEFLNSNPTEKEFWIKE